MDCQFRAAHLWESTTNPFHAFMAPLLLHSWPPCEYNSIPFLRLSSSIMSIPDSAYLWGFYVRFYWQYAHAKDMAAVLASVHACLCPQSFYTLVRWSEVSSKTHVVCLCSQPFRYTSSILSVQKAWQPVFLCVKPNFLCSAFNRCVHCRIFPFAENSACLGRNFCAQHCLLLDDGRYCRFGGDLRMPFHSSPRRSFP